MAWEAMSLLPGDRAKGGGQGIRDADCVRSRHRDRATPY